jgi:hypothetical protein
MQAIGNSNNLPIKLLQKLYHQTAKRENQRTEQNENKKWTTFTYYSPKLRAVTNIFKNTNLRIAFKTTSTLQQLTRQRQQALPLTTTEVAYIRLWDAVCLLDVQRQYSNDNSIH